ncbi:MAG TPA: phosphotransferase family protein [Conexibacter sp.]
MDLDTSRLDQPAPAPPDDVVADADAAAVAARPPLLVLEPLTRFLDRSGLGAGPLTAEPIGEGNSNATFVLRRGEQRFVLRRPPRPPIPPGAHDVLREARVMSALAGRVRVPRMLAACTDSAVIGAPFYVAEHLDGHVLTSAVPAALDAPGARRSIGGELIDALVELHRVDWRAAGLERFGRPDGYLPRQLRRFGDLWQRNRTRPVPGVQAVQRELERTLPSPPEPEVTIVHGDYRLGNAMLAPLPPARVLAILDWELSTLGDPLADVGYLAATWVEPDDAPLAVFSRTSAMREPGFMRRDELLAQYEERSGRSMRNADWYGALALWKTAVFMEGNYRRALAGMADDPFLLSCREGVPELASRAAELLGIATG